MNRNNWKALVPLLLCVTLLTACNIEKTQQVTGLVTELQVDDNGDLTGFVIQTDAQKEIGLLLTEKTFTATGESHIWTQDELRAAFQTALQPDVAVDADFTRRKRILTTDSGAQIPAYEASYIRITGRLNRGAVTMRDGTPIDVIEDRTGSHRAYRLADGTNLLRVWNTPHGPENSYVDGVEGFDNLSETAQGKVLAYYEQRGVLYDEQEELEKLYALYQKLGADFQPGFVQQSVSPTASSDRVMYFLTIVNLPTGHENGNVCYEIHLSDAFDRATGVHIDTWDLFSAPKETVVKTLLDKSGLADHPLRAEMEAVSWDERIAFFLDSLLVQFEWDSLPSETGYANFGFSVDYDPIVKNLMQDWAIPKSQD